MSMILYNDFRMFIFDVFHQLPQHFGTTDTCHIFQADFRCPRLYQLISDMRIIFHGMYRRISDAKSSLRDHPRFLGIFYGRDDIPNFIQTAKDTGNVHTLRMFHLVHQTTYIGRDRIHPQCIQAAVQHVRLDTRLS